MDGSPSAAFREELRRIGGRVEQELKPGMGPARRQAIALAMELAGPQGAVCFMEPEKGPLIPHLAQCFEPILTDKADIVIPCRSARSMRSYPKLQQLNEPFGNYSFAMATGRDDLDMFFGPRVFGARALDLFLKERPRIPGGNSWGTTHYPVIEAIARGLRVLPIQVDYIHPREQTEVEDNPTFYLKRIEQVHQLSLGYFAYAMQLGLILKDRAILKRAEEA